MNRLFVPSQIKRLLSMAVCVLGLCLAQNDFNEGAQSSDPKILDRCNQVFTNLQPQLLYLERAKPDRFWIRLVLGVNGLPLSLLTLSVDLNPVPLGLEDIALQALRPVVDRNRILKFVGGRFPTLANGLSLGNWTVTEPKGYRCFLTYQGRVVGVIRLTERLLPRPDPRWVNQYRRSPLRYPVEEPALQPPQ